MKKNFKFLVFFLALVFGLTGFINYNVKAEENAGESVVVAVVADEPADTVEITNEVIIEILEDNDIEGVDNNYPLDEIQAIEGWVSIDVDDEELTAVYNEAFEILSQYFTGLKLLSVELSSSDSDAIVISGFENLDELDLSIYEDGVFPTISDMEALTNLAINFYATVPENGIDVSNNIGSEELHIEVYSLETFAKGIIPLIKTSEDVDVSLDVYVRGSVQEKNIKTGTVLDFANDYKDALLHYPGLDVEIKCVIQYVSIARGAGWYMDFDKAIACDDAEKLKEIGITLTADGKLMFNQDGIYLYGYTAFDKTRSVSSFNFQDFAGVYHVEKNDGNNGVNPTNPNLPDTGSDLLVLGFTIMSIAGLSLVAKRYLRK